MQGEWQGNVYYVAGRPAMGRPAIFRVPNGEDIKLPVHEAYIASRALRQMAAFHRRGRKSGTTLEKVFKYLWANPGIVGKTLAPQLKQAREIIWDDPDMLFHPNVCPPSIIAKINKSDRSILLKNGSIWSLDGADDPQTKRGGNVKVLHLTEAGDHQEELWTQVYEPILIANGGIAFFEGNFRGKNWYARLFDKAREGRPGWAAFLLSARNSPIFSKEELDDLEQNTPDAVFRSEYLCEAVDSMGTVFRNFERLATAVASPAVKGRRYRIGVDLAKNQDYTVVTVVDRHTWKEVRVDRFNALDWTLIKERIIQDICDYSLIENDNEAEVVIEINGVGDPVFDDIWKWTGLEEISSKYKIYLKPFTMSNAAKGLLVSNLSMLFDKALIEIIKDDFVMRELSEFTYKKTALYFIYSHPDGGHDDTVISKMLAYWDMGAKLPMPLEEQPEKYQWGFSQDQIRKIQQQKAQLDRINSLM